METVRARVTGDIRRAALLLVLMVTPLPASGQSERTEEVRVGPNLQISTDDGPVVELDVAVDPTSPDRLMVGGVIAGESGSRVWISTDGGSVWTPFAPIEQLTAGGADPRVLFLDDGTALFTALSRRPGIGRTPNDLHVFRSEGALDRWETRVLDDASYDYPILVGDDREPGTVHLIVRAPLRGALLARRSRDGGRTFEPPVTLASSSTSPLLLRDAVRRPGGGYVLPYLESSDQGTRLLVLAADGTGDHPSEVEHVATFHRSRETLPPGTRESLIRVVGGVTTAATVDRATGVTHLFWRASDPAGPVIAMSRSGDGGRTWSAPEVAVRVGPGTPVHVMAADDGHGVVGLAWVTRTDGGEGGPLHQVWFSATTDGGVRWLPPRRVTTDPFPVEVPGNLRPWPQTLRISPDATLVLGRGATSRFPTGGDYLAMVATSPGRFRPVWADTRSGAFQAWTAAVAVGEDRVMPPTASEPSPLAGVVPRVDRLEVSEDGWVAWTRLHNTSPDTAWAPLTAEISVGDEPRSSVEYSGALGDYPFLPPGGISEALPLTLRPGDRPARLETLRVRVLGRRR